MIVALGSGAGGSGRTTLAMEMAKVFVRRGVSTVLVDCAVRMPIIADLLRRGDRRIHRQASLFSPGAHLVDFIERTDETAPAILTLADAVGDTNKALATAPEKLLRRFRRLDDRLIVLDLPAGSDPFWSDLFVLSDVPIIVSQPDPWSVRSTLPFLTAATDRATLMTGGPSGSGRLRTYLLLNGCRDASERDLGEVLCHAIWRRLKQYPRYLGHVDFDDRRWFHLRHTEEVPPLSSSEGLGVQVEEIAKRILALREFDESRPRTGSGVGALSGARWLGLSEMADHSTMRAQYRRLWEGYRRESAISRVMLDSDERAELISELEQTYRALQTAMDSPAAPVEEEAPSQSDEQSQPEVEPEPPKASHAGEKVKYEREKLGLSLREFSLQTRIGLRYLEAIEAMEVEALPRPVYLRGYLREIARVLDFPIDSLLNDYLTELTDSSRRSDVTER